METSLTMVKGLADGNRLRIVAALMEHDELSVCQLTEMLGLALPFTPNIFWTTAELFCMLSAWRHKTKSSEHWLSPKISNIFVI